MLCYAGWPALALVGLAQPRLGHRHYLHPSGEGLGLSDGRAGLVLALCAGLGDRLTLEILFVLSAVDRALSQATPAICNSDQGSHFTGSQYLERLVARGVWISMDSKGHALDNVFTERLWRAVKYEEVNLHEYDSTRTVRAGLAGYFYRTPSEVYFDATPQDQTQAEEQAERRKSITL